MKRYRLTETGRKHLRTLVEWVIMTGVFFILGCLSNFIEFHL